MYGYECCYCRCCTYFKYTETADFYFCDIPSQRFIFLLLAVYIYCKRIHIKYLSVHLSIYTWLYNVYVHLWYANTIATIITVTHEAKWTHTRPNTWRKRNVYKAFYHSPGKKMLFDLTIRIILILCRRAKNLSYFCAQCEEGKWADENSINNTDLSSNVRFRTVMYLILCSNISIFIIIIEIMKKKNINGIATANRCGSWMK